MILASYQKWDSEHKKAAGERHGGGYFMSNGSLVKSAYGRLSVPYPDN